MDNGLPARIGAESQADVTDVVPADKFELLGDVVTAFMEGV